MKNLQKNSLRNHKGVTLIALVVTIIVLLILAAVSIFAITGENGLFTKAKNASLKTDQGSITELLRTSIYTAKTQYYNEDSIDYLQYLKDNGYVTTDTESNFDIVNVSKVSTNIQSGKGTYADGDVYYLVDGELFYYSEEKKVISLGIIYTPVSNYVENPDLFLYEDEEKTIIIGAKYQESRMDW